MGGRWCDIRGGVVREGVSDLSLGQHNLEVQGREWGVL